MEKPRGSGNQKNLFILTIWSDTGRERERGIYTPKGPNGIKRPRGCWRFTLFIYFLSFSSFLIYLHAGWREFFLVGLAWFGLGWVGLGNLLFYSSFFDSCFFFFFFFFTFLLIIHLYYVVLTYLAGG